MLFWLIVMAGFGSVGMFAGTCAAVTHEPRLRIKYGLLALLGFGCLGFLLSLGDKLLQEDYETLKL